MQKRFLAILIFVFIFFSPFIAFAADGAFNYEPMEKIPGFESETVGNFYTYVGAVYKFGLWTVGIVALFMISFGGYMYITSAGNNANMTKAKEVIFDAIAGVVLALVSYLILYEINPNLVRLDGGELGGGASQTEQSTGVGAQPGIGGPVTGDEATNRQKLNTAGISVNRPNACPPGQGSGCTSTAGMRETTLNGVINLKKDCPNCTIVLNGGSESHSSGKYSHANGYKADLDLNPGLNSYIENTYAATGTRRGDGAKLYTDPYGNVYAKESDHWDVCYSCAS